MENMQVVNGLSLEDIERLYRILVDYETSYKGLSAKKFNKDFSGFKKIKDLVKLSNVDKADMKNPVTSPELNQVLMTVGQQPSHLIKHLRNAFAHSQLIRKEGYVELKDYPQKDKNKKLSLSAYGKLSLETFEEILNILTDK